MAMQRVANFLVGGSDPGRAYMSAAPPTTVHPAGFELLALKICDQLHYNSTTLGCRSSVFPHCLEPSRRKLLIPPPPPQKSDIQF